MVEDEVKKWFDSHSLSAKVSFDEFLNRYKEIKDHFGDLLDFESAMELTEYSFGVVEIKKISELRKESGKVTIRAKVKRVEEIRGFVKEDGEGLLVKILLEDDSGEIKAILWDDAGELVKVGDVFEGCFVELSGFLRRSDNTTEISVNNPLDVRIIDMDSEERNYDGVLLGWERKESGYRIAIFDREFKIIGFKSDRELPLSPGKKISFRLSKDYKMEKFMVLEEETEVEMDEYFDRISSLNKDRVNIYGRISGIGKYRLLKRDDRTIKLADIYVSDKTGRIRVVLWGSLAEIFKKADVGQRIVIVNGRFRNNEIHCDRNTMVNLLDVARL
jgi:replication factor A1